MAFSAFLDTCVLVPSVQRDLLLETASAGAFRPLWSSRVEEELRRTLKTRHEVRKWDPEESQAYITRLLRNMNRALPDARVVGWEWLEESIQRLPDPDDRHVVAAALQGQASVIVTANLKDFLDSALPGNLFGQHPDEFLLDLLDLSPTAMEHALSRVSERTGVHGPRWSISDLLDRLEHEHLSAFVAEARRRFQDVDHSMTDSRPK